MFEQFDELNDDNFVLFAAKNYSVAKIKDDSEFYEDLNRFKYIKKLFNRYENDKNDLKERLILNHIIIIANVFGIQAAVLMLYFKVEKRHHNILRTFLVYLGYIYDTDETPFDPIVVKALRRI